MERRENGKVVGTGNLGGEDMGRRHFTLENPPRGTHFTWDERLELQYYYTGANGYPKIRSPAALARHFGKSERTIRRELKRGMVVHSRSNPPFEVAEYNAEHAQLDAEYKMSAKGPPPKSARHYEFVRMIAYLIKERHYSPYAVLEEITAKALWPEGVRICEKTLYNWIKAGDIPGVTMKALPRKGKMECRNGKKGKIKSSRAPYAVRSIEKRPEEAASRRSFGHWEGGYNLQFEEQLFSMPSDACREEVEACDSKSA